jgi:DNA-binding MarR family transcriptional regulator/GNAT superfamily N-acetyltransferase
VAAARRFNRFYTRQIGVLGEGLLHSPYSLTELRVMFELAHGEVNTAAELMRELSLDAGYLSRILRSFEERGLILKKQSPQDGRRALLSLSKKGKRVFSLLDGRANQEVASLLQPLLPDQRRALLTAMLTIENLLGSKSEPNPSYLLRPHRPGDMGWVVHRHGVLYSQEYGWDERFEALVAEIVAKFVQNFDPKCERCWIAERDGEAVGSVFLVKHGKAQAKLRLLLVEPSARGLGIGRRLVEECIRFARQAGYRRVTLWTQSNLAAARNIYRKAGFVIAASEAHRSFGYDLTGETWELQL